MKTPEGAPRVPQGVIPHETTPTITSLGEAPWTIGPPESPEQAERPPVNGPVQKFVSSTKSPSKFKLFMAALHSSREIVDKIAFCKMFAAPDPPVDPHPLKVPGPTGTVLGCGNLTGRTRALKVNGAAKRI